MNAHDRTTDLISKLLHDHVPLSRTIHELRAALGDATATAPSREAHARIAAGVRAIRDDLIEHFAKEEEGLFPFLVSALPGMEREITALAAAHDGICGAAVRLAALADRDYAAFAKAFTQVRALFGRFEVAYAEHSKAEQAVLTRVAEGLSDEQRRLVAELARDL
ncbi:MAG: hemerythrin domain-containing protein [Myxococcales bacterium]|nr:hemerythrin domain-containing protein [Myxococcales bacterium]